MRAQRPVRRREKQTLVIRDMKMLKITVTRLHIPAAGGGRVPKHGNGHVLAGCGEIRTFVGMKNGAAAVQSSLTLAQKGKHSVASGGRNLAPRYMLPGTPQNVCTSFTVASPRVRLWTNR